MAGHRHYALGPHADDMAQQLLSHVQADGLGQRTYLLVDQAQAWPTPTLSPVSSAWRKRLEAFPHKWLFEGTFAHAALHLSPVLIDLSSCMEHTGRNIQTIERPMQHLPASSVLITEAPLLDIAQHIQTLFKLEVDSEPMIWRLADTHMLMAVLSVMTASQRGQILGPIRHWWLVNHHQELIDLTRALAHERSPLFEKISLSQEQTQAMLDYIRPLTLAAQLRQLEPSFANALAHADQIKFSETALRLAEAEGVDLDEDMVPWALQYWADVSTVSSTKRLTHERLAN